MNDVPRIAPPIGPTAPTRPTLTLQAGGSTSPRPRVMPLPARVRPRALTPDLTGRYEHVPRPGTNSAAVLHLNQAGHALVGWFTGPPPFVTGLSPTTSRTPELNQVWLRPGVLVARLGTAGGWEIGAPCYWSQSQVTAPDLGTDLMALDGLDPPDAMGDNAHVGYLRSAGPAVGIVGQEVQLMFEWAGKNKDEPSSYDRFLRVSAEARLPNFLIQQMPTQIALQLYADQVRPVPSSEINARRAAMAGIGDQVPPLARLLIAWAQAPAADTSLRALRREAVGNYVRGILDPTTPASYRSQAFDPVRAQMAWKDLTIGVVTQPYLQWLRQVGAEELARARELQAANPATAPKEVDNGLLIAFRRAGLMPEGDFLYTFSFNATSRDVDTLRKQATTPQVPGGGKSLLPGPVPLTRLQSGGGSRSPLEIIKLQGGIFKLDVKKEKVTLQMAADGSAVLKDGAPVVLTRSTVWNTGSAGLTGVLGNGYVGVFGEVGTGISFAGSSGKGSASSGLSTISMSSGLDLEPEDFAYARFSATLLAGPKVKLGEFVSLDVFSSRLVQVTLSGDNGGFTIDAIETTAMKAKTIEASSLKPTLGKDLQKVVDDYDRKWTRPQVEARLLELSTSRAIIVPLFDAKPRTRVSEPTPRPKTPTDSKFGSWFVEGFFALDSADLDVPGLQGALGSGTPRDLLEVHLATERAMLTSAEVRLQITGMTSPEQPAADNLVLSQNRAAAVEQALKDAFGPTLAAKIGLVSGVGETYALEAGLLDPEASGFTRAQFVATHPDQVRQWPFWRRTDLLIDGTVVVRVQSTPPR